MMSAADLQTQWLNWWHQGWWQQADASWQDNPFFRLDAQQQLQVASHHPLEVARGLGASVALPATPSAHILQIVALNVTERTALFDFVREICAPHQAHTRLSASQKIGCRRIARALRCENWLDAEHFAPQGSGVLVLLRELATSSWPRLRLSLPQEGVQQSEAIIPAAPLPATRLNALWEAALWHTQQSETTADVDTKEDHSAT